MPRPPDGTVLESDLHSRDRGRGPVSTLVRVAVIAAAIATVSTGRMEAQPSPADGLDAGWASYQSGKFPEAAASLEKFTAEQSGNAAYLGVFKRVTYLLALCYVKTEDWAKVHDAVERFAKATGEGQPGWEDELTFWNGVALVKTGEPAAGREALLAFLKSNRDPAKRFPAILLVGSAYTAEGKSAEAAAFYAQAGASLPTMDAARLRMLELDSYVAADDLPGAIAAADRGFAVLDEMPQVVAFQLLALQLAEKLIEADRVREAIAILLRIGSREELLALQQQRIDQLAPRISASTAGDPGLAALSKLSESVKSDAARLADVPDFDSMVRFRLASAFLRLKRYNELTFILSGMLADLPADAINEQASDTLVRSYMQVGRWPRVVETARAFREKFPNSASLPGVMLLEAQGLQEQGKLDEAEKAFGELVEKFPQDDLTPEATFLRAFNDMLREEFESAIAQFQAIAQDESDTATAEKAMFWTAEAESMRKAPDATITAADAYLEKYPRGEYAPDALYRKAFALHALRDYEASVPLLETFLKQNPGHTYAGEALLLKADAALAQGDTKAGLALLASVAPGPYYEEAQFRTAKVHRLAEDHDALREHLEKFVSNNPASARLAEAVYWIAWSWRDDPAKQNAAYWTAIDRFGNDPAQWGVQEILQGLIKANGGEEAKQELAEKFRQESRKAELAKKRSLDLQLRWAQAELIRKSDPGAARQLLVDSAPFLDPARDNPQILVAVADALRAAGKRPEASALYADIRRWNPTSTANDRVFAALGGMSAEDGDYAKALEYFDRFDREIPSSALRAEIGLASANALVELERYDEAIQKIETLLDTKSAPKRLKASALVALGRIEITRGEPRRAVAPLQRVYVLYGAYPELAAEAYVETAKSLEKLDDPLGAARTYLEFLETGRLDTPATKAFVAEARKNLADIPAATRTEAEAQNRAAAEAVATASVGGAGS